MSELLYGDQLEHLRLEYNRTKGFAEGRKLVEYIAVNR